jgi:CRP-like cAMP-binding protein
MPHDWLHAPIEESVAELIGRKRRAKTIELLRSQLQGRVAPNAQVRMQLCDLLVQAGRESEAVPVLLGLADEFAADGFVAKAVALLKRVEKIDPGPHVDSRLEEVVRQQRLRAADASKSRGAPSARGTPGLGMETGAADLPEIEVEPETIPELPADALEAVPLTDEEAAREREAAPRAEPVPVLEGVLELLPEPAALPEPEAPRDMAPAGVAGRIRGVFRRFLAALPGTEPIFVEPLPNPDPEPPLADAIPVEVSRADEPASVTLAADPEVLEVLDVDELPLEDPGRSAAAAPGPADVDHEPMSDAAFEAHLLDLAQEVLHRPPPAPRLRQPASALERGRAVEYASRLLATPLFGALSEEELLAVMRGLQLHLVEPGDVVITEGEPGQGLFVVVSGRVKVFVKNTAGRNFAVAALGAGEFFGEISSLSGRPRTATVVAAQTTELLELDRATLDAIAATHARVRDVLDNAYIARASSPEAAAVRAVPATDLDAQRRAIDVLEAHFGETRWDPRMRLRLADLLLKAGKDADAVPILIGLADDLAREGFPERAIAVLKKIERVQRRHMEVVSLAPLMRPLEEETSVSPPATGAPEAATAVGNRAKTEEFFQGWLVDVVRDTVSLRRGASSTSRGAVPGYGPGLLVSPLFEDFSEDELLAFIQGLRLLTFEAGDVVLTEGEPGESVFIVAKGTVAVFVRSPEGRNVHLCALGEGAFFGEMSTLSGEARSATVTAAGSCELLELDRVALGEISALHPRVLKVLEEFSRARAADPQAANIRRPHSF